MKTNEDIRLLAEDCAPIHDERIKQRPCEDTMESIIERIDCERILNLAENILPYTAYQIIVRRFGFYDGDVWDFNHIARELNVTREQAYAIYRESIQILKYKIL